MPPSTSFPKPSVVIFGSDRPVTCAIMDYSVRLRDAINTIRPGFAALETIDPRHPLTFVGAVVDVLRDNRTAHFQLPVEGWGNSLVPGSSLMAARLMTRKGRIAVTLHEWTSLNPLRYVSTIPDVLATDGFVFVSPRQHQTFQATWLVSDVKKRAAPVIPIGPNIMPAAIDPARVAMERVTTRGVGETRVEIVIGFFGVLYASKRPDLLLRVVRALLDRGVKTRLLICGDFLWDKPNDRATFLALADELGVADWLDFRGRIDDESELMATLSAADVFLLPFTDGVSVRRGSFQAVSQLAIPLVSTRPENPREFELSPTLKAKVDNAATVLCPIGAAPGVFADAVIAAFAAKNQAIGVDLAQSWIEAAKAHLTFYDGLPAKGGEA